MQTPAQPAQRKDARRPAARRECHKCPYNGTGDAYCWQKCPGPAEESNKGVSKVTLGGMEAEGEYIYNNAEQSSSYSRFSDPHLAATPPSPVTAELPYEVERSLVRILASMMSLTDSRRRRSPRWAGRPRPAARSRPCRSTYTPSARGIPYSTGCSRR